MGLQNAKWSKTGWIYSPELSYSVLWLSRRDGTWIWEKRNAWTAIPCFRSHLPALGCWGHRSYSLPPKNILFAVSDFSPAAAPAAPCWQERRGEGRGGRVR